MSISNSDEVELLVYGSANMDLITYVILINQSINISYHLNTVIRNYSYAERLPLVGETLEGHTFSTGFGGKGANQSVAAARLGARVALIAKLGEDYWAYKYEEQLLREGVIITHVKRCHGSVTGIAQIMVANNGENHIVIVPGANKLLGLQDIVAAKSMFAEAKILLCQLEVPVEGTLAAMKCFKGLTILNAAPALKDTPKELLESADILCLNETEAALMTQRAQISNIK